MEKENSRLTVGKEELERTCAKQCQQLTETRQQAKQRWASSDRERETMKAELEILKTEMERLKSREEKVLTFLLVLLSPPPIL